eukprot:scaffold23543_cov118-Isochrysis_galbana.AAC.2
MAKASQASARHQLAAWCAGHATPHSQRLRAWHVSCPTGHTMLLPTAQALYLGPRVLSAVFDRTAGACPPAAPRPGTVPGFDDPQRCCHRAPLVPSRTHLNGTPSAVARPCWGVWAGGAGMRATPPAGNVTSGTPGVIHEKGAAGTQGERWTC